MLATIRKRFDRDDEEGFTLIELMVVVLIIAILLAIAIPTFLGARERAQDRAAQSNIRNAYTAEKVHYTDAEAYTNNTTTLKDIEPSLTWEAAATPSDTGIVSVVVTANAEGTTGSVVCIYAESPSGTTFALRDQATGALAGTTYAKAATTCNTSAFGLTKW